MPQKKPQILLADDHPLMRTGLRLTIEESGICQVCAECGSHEELLAFLERSIDEIDLVILDLEMPSALSVETEPFEVDVGLRVLLKIRKLYPKLPILVLTAHLSPRLVHEAMDIGANGFLLKDEIAERLLEAIQAVFAGRKVYSGKVNLALNRAKETAGALAGLTEREKETLQYLAQGKRDKEVAEAMELSVRTVGFHKNNLKKKLNAKTTAELISIYLNSTGK